MDDVNIITESNRLHLGCGWNEIPGWLNTDHIPVRDSIFKVDATKRLPFQDDSFEFIYTEHMIEHLQFDQFLFLLKECFRVLKKDGFIRISTPDLNFLIKLFISPHDDLHVNYMNWSTSKFIPYALSATPAFVINNYVRDWGHRFIYDFQALTTALAFSGFTKVMKCEIGKSQIKDFENLENESRMPSGFLNLESLIVEAKK